MFSPDKPLPPPPVPPKSRNESLAAATMPTYRNRPTANRSDDGAAAGSSSASSAGAFSVSAARAIFEAAKKPEVRNAVSKAAHNPAVRNAAVSAAKNQHVRDTVAKAAQDPACRNMAMTAAKDPEMRQWAISTASSSSSAPTQKYPHTSSSTTTASTWQSGQNPSWSATTTATNLAAPKSNSLHHSVSEGVGSADRSPPPAFDGWNSHHDRSPAITSSSASSSWDSPKKTDMGMPNRFNSIRSELESLHLTRPGAYPATNNKIPPKRPPPPKLSPSLSNPNLSGSPTSEPHAIVKYPYNSAHVDELTCQPGDTVLLKKEVDDQWLYALNTRSGQYGIVPTVFLDVKVPLTPTPSRIATPAAFTASPKRPDSGSLPVCRALYDYDTGVDGDLQFRAGDRIYVYERVSTEWLRGRTETGALGIFPINFVQPEAQSPGGVSGRANQPAKSPTAGRATVTALYDYSSGNADDLSFQAGDLIEVIEQVGSEWIRGRLHGRIGLVPMTFVSGHASSPNLPQASSHFAGGGPSSSTLVGRIVTAQFDYSSTAVDDLNFTKGDRIQIIEEWLRGRLQLDLANQRSLPAGIFPRAFVA